MWPSAMLNDAAMSPTTRNASASILSWSIVEPPSVSALLRRTESIPDATRGISKDGGIEAGMRRRRPASRPRVVGRRAGCRDGDLPAEAAAGVGELSGDGLRQAGAELTVELVEVGQRLEPLAGVDAERLAQLRRPEAEPRRVEVLRRRQEADRRLLGLARAAVDALH